MDLSEYVGIPFEERGRTRAGADCYGLLAIVYRERFGITLPSYSTDYVTVEDVTAVSDLIAGNIIGPWREIPSGTEKPGDGLLMSAAGLPYHIGIVAGAGRVLHVERGHGAIIESYHAFRLKRRVLGFYRHSENERIGSGDGPGFAGSG
jgi:cell wall-associated NlpC family hydrolase